MKRLPLHALDQALAVDGQYMTWDDDTDSWIPASGPTLALDDLSDVNATGPADGNLIGWSASLNKWVLVNGVANRYVMPMTTVIGGVPDLVWDADNSLIATEFTP